MAPKLQKRRRSAAEAEGEKANAEEASADELEIGPNLLGGVEVALDEGEEGESEMGEGEESEEEGSDAPDTNGLGGKDLDNEDGEALTRDGEGEEEEDEEDDDESDEISEEDKSSDDSEDDAPRNRIGNVPLEWYQEHEHVGYDLEGQKIIRTLTGGEIDALLESKDNPDAWRTIKDHKNQREIVLTDTDLEVIRRIRSRLAPSAGTNWTDMVEFENKEAALHPMSSAHPPKSRFLPSKWERMRVKKLVALLREGKIRPPPPPAPEVWDLWADDAPKRRHGPPPLPAPKAALPGHAESYNPPSEYLLSAEEKKEWEDQDEQDRTIAHVPQKFDALRRVPGYKDFIVERFKRCLDLYLVPRALRQRMNVDPESLLPKLPSPKDLRPFPTHVSVSFEGHTGMVRSVAVDSTGQWLATASADETVRVWEVASGRCFRVLKFGSIATAVAWNPKHSLLAIAADEAIYFVDLGLEPVNEDAGDESVPKEVSLASILKLKPQEKAVDAEGDEEAKPEGAKARAVQWKAVPEDSALFKVGCRITIPTDGDVQQLTWHHKGNYCGAVSPKAKASANQCIIHAVQQQRSMRPFSKMKGGSVQACAFHPTKPHFLVATKMSVRIYDLQKQEQLKQLIGGAKWIGSLTMHPSGDHVVAGSYDRRLVWWDLDFGAKPFKTLQYHDRAVRKATFHPGKYPLLASASDDGSVSILHAKISNDLMQPPLIVPVKRLREHTVNQGFGVLDCTWHPTQPWLFTGGADHQVFMWS